MYFGGRDLLDARMSVKSGGLELYSIHGAWNLLGASSDDPPTVLILLRSAADAPPPVGLPTVSTGAVTPVSHDPASNQDLQMDTKLSSKLLGENMNHLALPVPDVQHHPSAHLHTVGRVNRVHLRQPTM